MTQRNETLSLAVFGQGLGQLFKKMRHNVLERLQSIKDKVFKFSDEANNLRSKILAEDTQVSISEGDIKARLKIDAATMPDREDEFKRAKREYFAYRTKHNITWEVMLPDRTMTLLHLALMVFIEAAIASAFLINAHITAGPVGAILIAVLISFTNIAVSTLAGYEGRWICYGCEAEDETEFKAIQTKAVLIFLIYLLVMTWFFLLVGMVQAQGSIDSLQVNLTTISEVFTHPHAVFLMMTGTVMSKLAYSKGFYGFDSAYPGLGNLYRIMTIKGSAVFEDMADACDEIKTECNEAIAEKQQALLQQEQDKARHQQLERQYFQAVQELEQAIETAPNELTLDIGNAIQDYEIASGRSYSLPKEELDKLVDFDHLLADIRAPTPLKSPQGLRKAVEQLNNTKYSLLDQYHQLMDDMFKPYEGE